jgi:hypothetical protein
MSVYLTYECKNPSLLGDRKVPRNLAVTRYDVHNDKNNQGNHIEYTKKPQFQYYSKQLFSGWEKGVVVVVAIVLACFYAPRPRARTGVNVFAC